MTEMTSGHAENLFSPSLKEVLDSFFAKPTTNGQQASHNMLVVNTMLSAVWEFFQNHFANVQAAHTKLTRKRVARCFAKNMASVCPIYCKCLAKTV